MIKHTCLANTVWSYTKFNLAN